MDYEELRLKCLKFAKGKRMTNESAQDFASFVLLKTVEGRKQNNLQLFLIDYLRSDVCNLKCKSGRVQKESFHPYDPVGMKKVPAPQRSEIDLVGLISLIEVDLRERVSFLLCYQWGFRQREVAALFNLHETNVNFFLSSVMGKLKQKLTKKELQDMLF